MFGEEFAKALLWGGSGRGPEVSTGDGSVLAVAEMSDHLCHVSVSSHADEELLEHACDRKTWSFESALGLTLFDTTRVLDEAEELAHADFISTAQGVLSSDTTVHAGSNRLGQIRVMDRLELGIFGKESLVDLAGHSALVHVVHDVSGVISEHQVGVKKAHLGVSRKGFLLSFLTLLNPRLFTVRESHVVLDGADGDHVGNTKLLGDLSSGIQSVVLAGGHGEVVVGEVKDLVGSLHGNLKTTKVGSHSLVKGDTVAGEFPLEVVHRCFVGAEVEHSDARVLSTLSEASDHTLGDVIGTVHYNKLHSSFLFNLLINY